MKLKNLLANKNVVTILGAILIVVVLYLFYNWRVGQAINPIKVPYATVTIGPRTEITPEMIGFVDVQESALKGNVMTNVNNKQAPDPIVGMYTNVNTIIPAGSFFYKEAVVLFKDLADSWLEDIPDDMIPYNSRVDNLSTYGNSIYPGNYIDVYFRNDRGDKIIYGKVLKNVKVAAVKDANGNNVFASSEHGQPNQIIFGVTEKMYSILRTAESIPGSKIELVPTNKPYDDEDKEKLTEISDEEIIAFIENYKA